MRTNEDYFGDNKDAEMYGFENAVVVVVGVGVARIKDARPRLTRVE